MNVKFHSTENGFDMEGRIMACTTDRTQLVVILPNGRLANVKMEEVISTDETVQIDGKIYFKVFQSHVPADILIDPASKEVRYKVNEDLVRAETQHLLSEAVLEGKLIALAECKKMWGEGTLSLNQMIKLEEYYKQ